jgi:hypothetical protein
MAKKKVLAEPEVEVPVVDAAEEVKVPEVEVPAPADSIHTQGFGSRDFGKKGNNGQ